MIPPNILSGTIVRFEGSWSSGTAALVVKDDSGIEHDIPCDNGPTACALASMFPGFIVPGHMADNSAIEGQPILYIMDDLGLCLAELGSPADEED